MGLLHLPTTFVDSAGEIPSASKFNNNFNHINLVQFSLIGNGDMELFDAGPASAPNDWVLVGTGASVARTADPARGSFASSIVFGSTDSFLRQSAIELNYHKGKFVRAWCEVKTATPAIARLKISDGLGSSQSVFHTGSGNFEHLAVTHQLAAGATKLDLELHVEGPGSALFDVAVLCDDEDIERFVPGLKDLASLFGASPFLAFQEDVFANRPVAPSSPLMFFATDQKQLYLYSVANGEWNDIA